MAIQRVFVIWFNPLFHESMRLLLNHPDVEWVGATSDHVAAQDQIMKLRPGTILIEEGEEGGVPAEVIEILENSSADMRIIRLSLADNNLIVYHREQKKIGQAKDLLQLIQND